MAILTTIWYRLKVMITDLFIPNHGKSVKCILKMDDLLAQMLAIEEYIEENVKHIKANEEQKLLNKKQAIKEEMMRLLQEV